LPAEFVSDTLKAAAPRGRLWIAFFRQKARAAAGTDGSNTAAAAIGALESAPASERRGLIRGPGRHGSSVRPARDRALRRR